MAEPNYERDVIRAVIADVLVKQTAPCGCNRGWDQSVRDAQRVWEALEARTGDVITALQGDG